ncbi:Hypothetical predicted protein [Prunus dulcis]|uniref:Uncharacterized protein n=1 Tax=Prunus dulcis TaxID=3755 RepID=A0A5E4G360_PRUDU|nr:Hypothetical predicted protein [Prunus dulcis]
MRRDPDEMRDAINVGTHQGHLGQPIKTMAFPLLFLKVRGFLSGGNSFRSPRIVDTDRHRDLREREFLSLMRFNGIFAARFRTHERERHVRTVLESQFCPSNKYAFGCLRIP